MSAILISVLPKTLQHLEIHGLEKNILSDRDVEIIYVGILVPCLKQMKKYIDSHEIKLEIYSILIVQDM